MIKVRINMNEGMCGKQVTEEQLVLLQELAEDGLIDLKVFPN